MVSSWFSKLKHAKRSYTHRKTRSSSYPREETFPGPPKAPISLQPASIRAESSCASISSKPGINSEIEPHAGLVAFSVSSDLEGGYMVQDGFGSNDCVKADRTAPRPDADVAKVAASLIHDGIGRDPDLWDREFSSMSSYCSERDALSVKAMRLAGADAAVLKSMPTEEPDCTTACASDHELDVFSIVLDTASCSEISSNESVISCKCGCENHRCVDCDSMSTMPAPAAEREPSFYRKNDVSCFKKKRSNSSISAALPPDLRGVVGDSIALVKISHNPYEDFRESMYEMIMEKEDLEESTDMEELLYSYLSLNSPEHHQLIEEVFSDVWSTILMKLR